MANCVTCSGHIKNTGISSGDKPFGRITGMLLVPLVAGDGTANYLDASLTGSALDAELLGKINNPDKTKRFYPLLNLKNVEKTQEDATFEEDNAGERSKLMDGRETMQYEFWGYSRVYYDQVRYYCVDFGVILIDDCGNLLGEYDEVNERLYPREVNRKSYDARYVNWSPEATSKIIMQFDYDLTTSEADQLMLPFGAFDAVNANRLKGMIDLNIKVVTNTAGSVTVQADTIFGAIGQKVPWLGGSVSNITIENTTTPGSITPTSVTGDGSGGYVISYTGPTANDVLFVSAFAPATGNHENGFEGTSETYVEQ